MDTNTKFHINPTGRFVVGGPMGDAGLTGRKIIVDTYGGYSRHGGGAFSGKDPTKVDRSACYMARYVAKNLVAAGLARKVEVQLAYAIGVAEPVSVMVDSFGTGTIPDEQMTDLIRATFTLTPRGIIEILDLRRPIYRPTAAFGHFGRTEPSFTWERPTRRTRFAARLGSRQGSRPSRQLSKSSSAICTSGPFADLLASRQRTAQELAALRQERFAWQDYAIARRRRQRPRPGRAGQAQDRMGQSADARSAVDPQAIHQGAAAQGRARFRLPARDQRDGQPGHHAARWRRRRGAVRLESALDAGRSGRCLVKDYSIPDLRHQGRGQRHLLLAPRTPRSITSRR